MIKAIKHGFSLVELMVTLVVVAVLTAAMAPVITKRLKSKEITIAQGGGGLTMNCASISPQCGLCEGGVCVSCAKSCTENEALDIPNCACKACNLDDFHGSACLKCDIENCSKCINGYYLTSGNCTLCTDGYSCDGTNQNPCPAGYYCKDGVTTACTVGTYNDTTGATNESACVDCSVKTANCTNCDIATGVCSACASGYEIASGSCNTTEFSFSYSGAFSTSEISTTKTKIILKSSGTFIPSTNKNITAFLVGGGGAGAKCGAGGGGGYTLESQVSLIATTEYTVTIGAGATSAGRSGSKTIFGSLSVNGGGGASSTTGGSGTGKGGAGGTVRVAGSNGGAGASFNSVYYGGGGGGGGGTTSLDPTYSGGSGGNGGGGAGGQATASVAYGGSDGAENRGGGGGGGGHLYVHGGEGSKCGAAGKGGSGVVVLVVTN